jgi:hypothetical protein
MIGAVVALAMIAGWFLRIGAEFLPGWGGLAMPVSGLVLASLVEVLDRRIDKAIRDQGARPAGGES